MKLYEVVCEPDGDFVAMTGATSPPRFTTVLAHAGLLRAPKAERYAALGKAVMDVLSEHIVITAENVEMIAGLLEKYHGHSTGVAAAAFRVIAKAIEKDVTLEGDNDDLQEG